MTTNLFNKIHNKKKRNPNLRRNDPCWCGSGKKYKKCHWASDRTYFARKQEACRSLST
ncbi:MAG: SEC-C metal-binding domain-containing protein [bacterium]